MRREPSLSWLKVIVCAAAVVTSGSLTAQTIARATLPAAADEQQLEALLKQVDTAVEVNTRRYLVANSHSPWQIFHGILALRENFQVKLEGQKVSAIEWIATSEPKFDNEPLIVVTEHGANFHSFTRPYAFQGHPGQFLALLTQSNLPTDFKLKAGDKEVTIDEIIRDTKMNVNSQEEVTWVLWALNHYLDPGAKWTNKSGEAWSIERLVQIENRAVVERSACGGNHGLFAISRTRDKHLKTGQPLRGTWLEADQKIRRYAEIARALQNSDGSFSSKFYAGPEFSSDINTRLNTTGHTLEFLSASLPEQRLREPWVRKAVYAVVKDLYDNRHQALDCGPLYHSLNALMIYRDRVRAVQVPQLVVKPTAATQEKRAPASDSDEATPKKVGVDVGKAVPKTLPQTLSDQPVSALDAINPR